MYVGHKREDGQIQPLRSHLLNVANLASEFATAFGASRHAYRAGLLHDVGKYSKAGQHRMLAPEHTQKVDHATAGAVISYQSLKDIPSAFAISGHHGGLVDMGGRADFPENGTLLGRLKKRMTNEYDFSAYVQEIQFDSAPCIPSWLDGRDRYAMQFYIRMLFSCLVDADYLDTEAFMSPNEIVRGGYDSLRVLSDRLESHISPWLLNESTGINAMRTDILRNCLIAAEHAPGLFTLTVPTGGGKTLSSLAFALRHAVLHNLRRIIYVVPYTSIIEQNARVFSDVLGENNVLEHHSNVFFPDEAADDAEHWRLATENWDAPVIVTTAVQFFESLHASKPSQCRKLHNIAGSVVVFDEAQMLPQVYLSSCVACISELVKHYNTTAVLCTATQPALDDFIHEFSPKQQISEICLCPESMFDAFRRVCFRDEGQISDDILAKELSEFNQVLCIVNTRKRAQAIYSLLPEEGRFHLSTLMTPSHRTQVLSSIRRRLKSGQDCRVIATSLIEAGVDVDFPAIWREEAGLDSILQAAGRCNREGKRNPADSIVHVFRVTERPPRMIEQNIAAMQYATREHESYDSPEAIESYFRFLYKTLGKATDMKGILKLCDGFSFRTIAELFKLIDNDTVTVYIPSQENAYALNLVRQGIFNRSLVRKLGRSAVNIYRQHFDELVKTGKIEEASGFYILADTALYDEACGLSLSAAL